MPKYKIVFAPTAEKQLFKLSPPIRTRIITAIHKLSDDPFLGKLLKGDLSEYRSYRVGDYRVIYFIRLHVIQVEVVKIGHRRDIYR